MLIYFDIQATWFRNVSLTFFDLWDRVGKSTLSGKIILLQPSESRRAENRSASMLHLLTWAMRPIAIKIYNLPIFLKAAK